MPTVRVYPCRLHFYTTGSGAASGPASGPVPELGVQLFSVPWDAVYTGVSLQHSNGVGDGVKRGISLWVVLFFFIVRTVASLRTVQATSCFMRLATTQC